MVNYAPAVEKVVCQLFERFRSNPSLFFTESDLVCEFYRLFLLEVTNPYVRDAEGKEHIVIHTEYPTPFRCDMSDLRFRSVGEDETTERGKKFKRGHLDLVILNPEMIKELRADEVMMQNYARTRASIASKLRPGKPMALHAIEFQYARGKLTEEGANHFSEVIKQDHEKLIACCHPNTDCGCDGFIETIMSLVFLQTDSQVQRIEQGIRPSRSIKLCYPKSSTILAGGL